MRFTPLIVWNPKCVPPFVDSYSPSWKKPKAFVDHIRSKANKDGVHFHQSHSVRPLLKQVHSQLYVEQVLRGEAPTGFGMEDATIADSCTYTCGAMVEGVMRAVDGFSTCAPVSGFHHAGWDYGGGFCTFNGLALAAVVAKGIGLNPGIIDCDMHYGDGTDDILSTLAIKDIPHFTFGGTDFANKGRGDAFIAALPLLLDKVFGACKILLYQAGADPHIDDPLGGVLTTTHMKMRDDIVFRYAKDRGIPVVWNLAGGYQRDLKKVLALHEQTYESWLEHL